MEILAALGVLTESKYRQTRELNFLIEKSYSLAVSYLGLNHKKIFRLLHKGEYSIHEIAVDAIAPIFCPDPQTNLTPLSISFSKWTPQITTEDDAIFFLSSVISSRVEQHIYSSLREYDPFFSRILDSINYLVKSGGYKKIVLAGRSCIIENTDFDPAGQLIEHDDFENIPSALLIKRNSMLSRLFYFLKCETGFIPAVPVNLLVYRIKHINFNDYINEYSDSVNAEDFELSEYAEYGYDSAAEKLVSSYLKRGKLTEYESDCITHALKDISEDLLNGGIIPGMYEYLAPYMAGLNKEQYLIKYHNIVEYLVKVMKNTIAEKFTHQD